MKRGLLTSLVSVLVTEPLRSQVQAPVLDAEELQMLLPVRGALPVAGQVTLEAARLMAGPVLASPGLAVITSFGCTSFGYCVKRMILSTQ